MYNVKCVKIRIAFKCTSFFHWHYVFFSSFFVVYWHHFIALRGCTQSSSSLACKRAELNGFAIKWTGQAILPCEFQRMNSYFFFFSKMQTSSINMPKRKHAKPLTELISFRTERTNQRMRKTYLLTHRFKISLPFIIINILLLETRLIFITLNTFTVYRYYFLFEDTRRTWEF